MHTREQSESELTWSKLASYQYGVLRAQKSHNDFSKVPAFKDFKNKPHTFKKPYTLLALRPPLDHRLMGEKVDPGCLIKSLIRTLTGKTVWGQNSFFLVLRLSAGVESSTPPSASALLASALTPQQLMWECDFVGRRGFGPFWLRALSWGRGQHRDMPFSGRGQGFLQAPPAATQRHSRVWLMTSSSLATSVNISAYQLSRLSLVRKKADLDRAHRKIGERRYKQNRWWWVSLPWCRSKIKVLHFSWHCTHRTRF